MFFPNATQNSALASAPSFQFQKIVVGANHTLALGSNGYLYSWGDNQYGQLGDGTTESKSLPQAVSRALTGASTFIDIASGGDYNLALSSDGRIYSWGNGYAALGIGTRSQQVSPALVDTQVTFSSIAAGSNNAVGLTAGGVAYGWGNSQRVGDGSGTDRLTPVLIDSAGVTFSAISVGLQHTLALTDQGKVYAWGAKYYGAVGIGTLNDNSYARSPVAVSTQSLGVSTFSAISAGGASSYALTSNGKLFGWGSNVYGQLGDGTTTPQGAPIAIQPSTTFQAIAGRDYHVFAVRSDGALLSWGENSNTTYQLGLGSVSSNQSIPTPTSTQSSGISTFSFLAQGRGPHALAFSAADGWFYWGDNDYGQLGIGPGSDVRVPTQLPAFLPGPEASFGQAVTFPDRLSLPLSCSGSCGNGDNFNYSVRLLLNGIEVASLSGTSSSVSTELTFSSLTGNTNYAVEASVSYNGDSSATTSASVTSAKPTATISAITVLDTSATLIVGCTNCGTVPDSFTVSATPIAGGPAITSNTNQISGLSSETTYSFSVVVAFAGTTSDIVLWQSNPVMTLPFVPIVSAVSPPAVPLTGGSITVVGSNFTTSTELTLDGSTLSFTIVNGNQITFTAPSDTSGSYDLAITNPVGTYTLSNAITYVAGPTLVTNSPVLGTTNGGTIVTLTGTNLITTTQVNVGSTTVSFSVISNSVVRFVTAATSAGVVDIGVVTIGGAATLSSALEFTSSPLIPVVSSITPTSGPNTGGTLITVTGQYFSGSYSDSVSAAINGVSGSSVILIDDSTLTFVSPAGTVGAGLDISVATGGGFGTLAGVFTYIAPTAPVSAGSAPAVVINTPTITEFSTRKIPATGAQVTATGKRLDNTSVLTLGGITVTIVSNTPTTLTFTTGEIPAGVWDLRLVASNGTLVFQQAIEVVEIQGVSGQSSGELIGFAVTLRFTGNSRALKVQQEGHLQRRLKSEADTIICWGYTTAQDPNSWALAHANARAQAACNLALESMPGVSSIVRLRYGIPKDLAMRASVQFWKSTP